MARIIALAFAVTITGFTLGAAADNILLNPELNSTLGWEITGDLTVSPWSGSDGACLHGSSGSIWQHIGGWQLPYQPTVINGWYTAKSPYGTMRYLSVAVYGLKTTSAKLNISNSPVPNGVEGVDWDMLAGGPHMSTGNGFWWESSYYKYEVGHVTYKPVTRTKYPFGLVMSYSWSSGELGMDNFYLGMANNGTSPAGALRGEATGQTNQWKASYQLGYSGLGIDNPLWIDPVWATGYEYELPTNTAGGYWNSFKGLELPQIGDGLFDIEVWNGADWQLAATDINAADGIINFADIAPGVTVKKFRVLGIDDVGVNIDPTGHEFPIGVLFNQGGYSMDIVMTAVVPEPTTGILLAVGAASLIRRQKRRGH